VHLERFMLVLSRLLKSNPSPDVKECCLACLGTMSEELLDNKQ
jgi:hypothetical protein